MLAAITVFWFRFMVVALVVPIFRAAAVAVSKDGAKNPVSERPASLIQNLLVDWTETF